MKRVIEKGFRFDTRVVSEHAVLSATSVIESEHENRSSPAYPSPSGRPADSWDCWYHPIVTDEPTAFCHVADPELNACEMGGVKSVAPIATNPLAVTDDDVFVTCADDVFRIFRGWS